MAVKIESFDGVILTGYKQDAVEVPFDSSERWSITAQPLWPGRRGYAVTGKLNSRVFESFIVSRSRKFWLLLPTVVKDQAGVASGDNVHLEIAPNDSNKPKPRRGSPKSRDLR